jgi:hypothetical protein
MEEIEIQAEKPKLRYPKGLIKSNAKWLSKTAGKPATRLDANKLYELAQTLLPVEVIANVMGVSAKTIEEKYSPILQAGREDRKTTLIQRMWHKALVEGDTKMLIWLSKQYLGHKETFPNMEQNMQINVFTADIPK